MRMSYLIAAASIAPLFATGIPAYRAEAIGVFVVMLVVAIGVFLYEQKQYRGWPFKRGYTGR